MLRYYEIASRDEQAAPFHVRATGYQHAATIGARRLYGRKSGLCARQVTGNAGMSGYWQAYLPVPQRHGGGLTSYGCNYHVRAL